MEDAARYEVDMDYKTLLSRMQNLVFGQEQYVRTLCLAMMCEMQKEKLRERGINRPYPANTILIAGETGSGKTYAVNKLAKILGRELISIDMSQITGSGYKGASLMETIEKALQEKPQKEIEKAIFFFDELDKCLLSTEELSRAKTSDVIPEFLRLIEGGRLEYDDTENRHVSLSTDNMTFIFAGAFSGIEKIVEKRLSKDKKIGFELGTRTKNSKITTDNKIDEKSGEKTGGSGTNHNTRNNANSQIPRERRLYSGIRLEDFAAYNLDRQFLGRMERVCILNRLGPKDYERIMIESDDSMYNKYKHLLMDGHGVVLRMTQEARDFVTNQCKALNIGARGIATILSKVIDECMELTLMDEGIGVLVIDEKKGTLFPIATHCERKIPLTSSRGSKVKREREAEEASQQEQYYYGLEAESSIIKEAN